LHGKALARKENRSIPGFYLKTANGQGYNLQQLGLTSVMVWLNVSLPLQTFFAIDPTSLAARFVDHHVGPFLS
jgi:hypothetical protein